MNRPLIVTHSGVFHADDAFAVAVLEILHGELLVERTRDEARIQAADYVVDVGGIYDSTRKRFDHHQVGGAGKRPNGIPYAAFGLVWKEYGEVITGSKEVAEAVDRIIVQPTDAEDNGVELLTPVFPDVYPFGLGSVISSFLPTWQEKDAHLDSVFREVVGIAKTILLRVIVKERARKEAELFVREAYTMAKNKHIVVLEDRLPWREVIKEYPEPLFVIFPQDAQWHVSAVRDNPRSFENRLNLPSSWAGKREELREITGVPDALFCHNNLFMAVAGSKEGAIRLAERAIAWSQESKKTTL